VTWRWPDLGKLADNALIPHLFLSNNHFGRLEICREETQVEKEEVTMSVLKFQCPGCGQNMECDRACAGDVIHCPRCMAELRIPFNELPGALLRAELILHAPDSAVVH